MSFTNKNSPSFRFRYYGAAAVAAIAIGVGTSHFAKTNAAETEQAPRAANVTVAHPTVKSVIEWDEYTGRFAAINDVEVRARVSGYLQEVSFEDGQVVEKGDLLFKIDPRPFEAELAAAQAEMAGASAELQNAKAENERGQRLLKRSALSQEEADRRTRAIRQAEAGWAAAKALVDQAALNLEFTEIRAPINGRISDEFISEGNLVVGGAQAGTLLTTIVSLDPIYFEFTTSEADYLKYVRLAANGASAGLEGEANEAFVKLIDEQDFSRQGKMSFVDNQFDPSTGTMRGRATFNNPNGVISPGMFGRLQLSGSAEYLAVLIPDSAVQTDQSQKFVWLASDDNTAQRRVIETGPMVDGLRVVRTGIGQDDNIIISGAQFVADGAPISPTPTDQRVAQALIN